MLVATILSGGNSGESLASQKALRHGAAIATVQKMHSVTDASFPPMFFPEVSEAPPYPIPHNIVEVAHWWLLS